MSTTTLSTKEDRTGLSLTQMVSQGYVECLRCNAPAALKEVKDPYEPTQRITVCAVCGGSNLRTHGPAYEEDKIEAVHVLVLGDTAAGAKDDPLSARGLAQLLKQKLPGRNTVFIGLRPLKALADEIGRLSANHKVFVCDSQAEADEWERVMKMKFARVIRVGEEACR